ncbi:glycosyltransferase [Shewanella morhuae]|uniref:Chondroitin polymerase n=1 Tax=Shewanella morhuae TaxID=365591 RepID=A0A380A7B8_9GAMM|nr:glycosyltransferase [Shewanella morhuae]SUI75472.1 Chondroitin polymerase [Shewanella morhuae]
MELVSVYLITQNRSKLLKRAIESVFEQSYPTIQLIVVDDASTDDTQELIAFFKQKYDFIYLKNEVISGACFSRNRAIEVANGYYVTGLDDDDYFHFDRVAELVAAYDEKYAFVCSNTQELMRNNDLIDRSFGFKAGEFGLDKLLHHNLVGNQVLTTKTKFVKAGGFDVNMPAFQDYDTWVRLLRNTPLALKISARNYILETNHGCARISLNSSAKFIGYKLFFNKNKDLMDRKQLQSMELLGIKISGEQYGIYQLVKTINNSNYKSAINLYLLRNLNWFKIFLDNRKKNKTK